MSLVTDNPALPEWSTQFRATSVPDRYAAYDLVNRQVVLATCRLDNAGASLEIAAGDDHWIARVSNVRKLRTPVETINTRRQFVSND